MSAVPAPPSSVSGVRSERLISPVLVVMVALSAYGAWNVWSEQSGTVATLGSSGIVILLAWLAYGALIVGVVVALQRFARRPMWTVATALAWGGFACFWVAGFANTLMSVVFLTTIESDPHAWLSTPVVEESLKALGVLGLAIIPAVRNFRALDGLFYGVLVGAGFQVVEDAVYTLTTASADPSNAVSTLFGMLVLRGFTVGLFTHAVFTGVVGAAIGWAAAAPQGRRAVRIAGAVGVLLLMMGFHGVYNSQDSLDPVMVGAALIPLILLIVVLLRTRAAERRALAAAAADTDGWGLLGAPEVALLDAAKPKDRPTRRHRNAALRVAWACDHLGVDSKQTTRAVQHLAESPAA